MKSKYTSVLPVLPKRKYFKIGDTGNEVKLVQAFINWANNGTIRKKLKLDGDYGKLTAQAVSFFEEVHGLKQDGEFGKKCRKLAAKLVMDDAWMAVNWAVSIAKNNSFAYGTGNRAHHNGCYFCGTNITGPKKAKKGSRWEKTYCCNTFIHAAYAHGAGVPKMLRDCKRANAAGMNPSDWTKYGFIKVGKCKNVKFADLKHGDVIIKSSHVFMYVGGNRFVEATSSDGFGADSIIHKKGMKSRYRQYQKVSSAYVMRFK